MKQRVLGQNLTVSAIGYSLRGLMNKKGSIDETAAVQQIQAALDKGLTFMDASDGNDTKAQEMLFGKALGSKRKEVVLAAGGPLHIDSVDALRQAVDEMLERLQTDWVDLFYVRDEGMNLSPEDIAGVIKEEQEAGKIRHWALTNGSPLYIERAHAVCPVTAIAEPFSMMVRWNEAMFPILKRLHIGLVAHYPLDLGGTSRGYLSMTEYDKKMAFRLRMMKYTKSGTPEERALVKFITKLGKEKEVTTSEIALAWVLRKKPWIVPVQGAATIEELDEIVHTADVTLGAKDMDAFAIHLGPSTFDVTV